ncbi:MAG: hypothetical protein V3W44_10330 [Dehalococcoidales bacterium]
MPALPPRTVLLWSGAISTIPPGFVFCNGANGTPDLRARFVVGAGPIHPVDETGGSTTHSHTFTTDGHTHTIGAGGGLAAGTDNEDTTSENTDSGTTGVTSAIPPYYSLAFIMKT